MASTPHVQFAKFIASKGRTISEHVACVVNVALEQAGTFGHADIVSRIRNQASHATVYRTLATMVDAGVLRRVQFNGHLAFVVADAED